MGNRLGVIWEDFNCMTQKLTIFFAPTVDTNI